DGGLGNRVGKLEQLILKDFPFGELLLLHFLTFFDQHCKTPCCKGSEHRPENNKSRKDKMMVVKPAERGHDKEKPCCRQKRQRNQQGYPCLQTVPAQLPVLPENLEVSLRMDTCRTFFRSICTCMQIAAVAAAPDNRLVTSEDTIRLDICIQIAVALFMLLLCHGYCIPDSSDFRKSFLFCSCCKRWIKLGMFLIFTVYSCQKVLGRGAHQPGRETGHNFKHPPFKKAEEPLGMLFLLICRLLKSVGNLDETLFSCHSCGIGIAIACLALSGKRFNQILLRLRTLY